MIWLLMLALAGPLKTGFTSFRSDPSVLLEGNWQSCRDEDGGEYGERIFDAYDPLTHKPLFELHLGPYHDFALFRGVIDEHRDHDRSDNLLKPHTVDVAAGQGKQTWHVLGYTIIVTLAGGSYDDCESWFISVQRPPK